MRVRWIAVVFIIGAYFAWRDMSSIEAYATAFGCLLLYSLRVVEVRIERIEGKMSDLREPKKPKPTKKFYGFSVPTVREKGLKYPAPLKLPDHLNEWQPMVSHFLASRDFLSASYRSTPLAMRKQDPNGNWMYREPTEQEVQDYIHAEPW